MLHVYAHLVYLSLAHNVPPHHQVLEWHARADRRLRADFVEATVSLADPSAPSLVAFLLDLDDHAFTVFFAARTRTGKLQLTEYSRIKLGRQTAEACEDM